MKVELLSYTIDPVMQIEHAASNCYDSDPTGDGKLLRGCIKSGHTAVTEFATFTFHISEVSRALMAQLTRHRHASFCIRSQRYCNEDNFKYVVPGSIVNSKFAQEYEDLMQHIRYMYANMTAVGIPEEDARYILPNACATEIECSMNFRELMQFCNLRLCNRAQWEIRKLAVMMRDAVIEVMPEAKDYLVPNCEKHAPYYFCTESRSCGKHKKLKEVYKDV